MTPGEGLSERERKATVDAVRVELRAAVKDLRRVLDRIEALAEEGVTDERD